MTASKRFGWGASLALVLPLVGCAASQVGDGGRRYPYSATHISATIGQRSFEDSMWEPVDDHPLLGLGVEVQPSKSWVALDFAAHYGEDDTSRVVGGLGNVELGIESWELSAGLYKELRFGDFPIRPYLGGGLAFLSVDAAITDSAGATLFSDDDTTFAPYARVGLLFDLYEGGQLGLDLRHLTAGDVDVGGVELDADYTQLALVFRGRIVSSRP